MKLRFAAFEFDAATRELRRDGRPVHLSPKAFDLLQVLLEQRPRLVSKDDLQDRLWPDSVVLEANLVNAVAEIRRALGDNPKAPAFVATVSRRGYRFAADAEPLDRTEPPSPAASRWWLVWRDLTLPLAQGTNIVGRHPQSDVWLNAASVSRVHAEIAIAGESAAVEDRQSTNGTFVNGQRISSRHPLVDGMAVTFGSEPTVYRCWSDTAAPPTERVY